MKERQKVFVGMSGGVDSSVSAALLVEDGYDVTGVFIKAWHPEFIECSWRDDRRDAMAVCARLGIPFETCDLEAEYKRDVVDYMVREYKAGRTPNPDVMCNQHVKFGAFYQWARKRGADLVATGHYARVFPRETRETPNSKLQIPNNTRSQNRRTRLFTGRDTNKDQSYFLWAVDKNTLHNVRFPIGEMTKPDVRAKAEELGLPVADKKDSQGICFLGDVQLDDFLRRFLTLTSGDVLNEAGEVIGAHKGALVYTIGQRHGFTVTDKKPDDGPFYVVAKDIDANTITVSQKGKPAERFAVDTATITDLNWIGGVPVKNKKYLCRFRYRQPLVPCTVESDDITATIRFKKPQSAVTLGQSLVVYLPAEASAKAGGGNECLGGGVINSY